MRLKIKPIVNFLKDMTHDPLSGQQEGTKLLFLLQNLKDIPTYTPFFSDVDKISEKIQHIEDFLDKNPMSSFTLIREFYNSIHHEYNELIEEESFNQKKFKTLKLNATMLLVEIKDYLNQSPLFPRPILKMTQDLSEELSVMTSLKSATDIEKLNSFETIIKETKDYLEECKTHYFHIKHLTTNKELFKVSAKELNNLIFDYQNGKFNKIKAKFE